MNRHLETNGVGSALRMLYRPIAMFSDAFDFLTVEDHPAAEVAPPPIDAFLAIADMRHAANRLNRVANASIDNSKSTPRQVIDEATDEAADFND